MALRATDFLGEALLSRAAIVEAGELIECREPTAPGGAAPSSVIFVGKRCGAEQTNPL